MKIRRINKILHAMQLLTKREKSHRFLLFYYLDKISVLEDFFIYGRIYFYFDMILVRKIDLLI
jgi:hypothetical protein